MIEGEEHEGQAMMEGMVILWVAEEKVKNS